MSARTSTMTEERLNQIELRYIFRVPEMRMSQNLAIIELIAAVREGLEREEAAFCAGFNSHRDSPIGMAPSAAAQIGWQQYSARYRDQKL
jgi:hypothetical protein